MTRIKTNINFVNHLLNTKGISERQRFIILSLFNSEMLNYEQDLINQFLNSDKDGLTQDGVLDPLKNKNILYHLPKRTTHLLKLFTANDILKYTTH